MYSLTSVIVFFFTFLAAQLPMFYLPIKCWWSVLEQLFTIHTLPGRFHPHSWFFIFLTWCSPPYSWLPNMYLLAQACPMNVASTWHNQFGYFTGLSTQCRQKSSVSVPPLFPAVKGKKSAQPFCYFLSQVSSESTEFF